MKYIIIIILALTTFGCFGKEEYKVEKVAEVQDCVVYAIRSSQQGLKETFIVCKTSNVSRE